MKFIIYTIFIVSAVIPASCKNELGERKITQIDSLQQVISVLQKKFQNSDTSEYNKIYNKIISSTKIFKKYAVDIPKDQNFRNRFAEFTQLEKNYKELFKQYYIISDELNYTLKQLDNLKSDIQNNALNEQDKIISYFNQESESVKKVSDNAEKIFKNAESYKAAFNKLCNEMEAYANKLKVTNIKK